MLKEAISLSLLRLTQSIQRRQEKNIGETAILNRNYRMRLPDEIQGRAL
jgi:hypothetical protein